MYELTDDALLAIGEIFVDMMKKKIQEKIYPYGNPDVKGRGDKVASGKLLNSLSVKLVPSNGTNAGELQITYEDYFKYVNLGRKPGKKLVPIKSILEWIKIRGIKGRNKKGQFIPRLSFAFAIQRNIFKYGIRPSNIYDKGLDALEDVFNNPPPEMMEAYNELYAAIENDVINFIESNITEQTIRT
jgi:hypothetical protein